MNTATYTAREFFYEKDFSDYIFLSGVPYTSDNLNVKANELAKTLAQLDTGEGISLDSFSIEKLIPNLNKYDEFVNCKLELINAPVFATSQINVETLNVEKEFRNVSTFEVDLDENFIGESFSFVNTFYIYHLSFFYNNGRNVMLIRGFESEN